MANDADDDNKKVRKYISVMPESYHIRSNFALELNLRQVDTDAFSLFVGDEDSFCFSIMTTQGRNTYWSVTWVSVDSPIQTRSGSIFGFDSEKVERQINAALTEMLVEWVSTYQPRYY